MAVKSFIVEAPGRNNVAFLVSASVTKKKFSNTDTRLLGSLSVSVSSKEFRHQEKWSTLQVKLFLSIK
jgi:hypothetical protein